MTDLKNTITNIGAIVILVAGAVQAYIQTLNDQPINFFQLGLAVVVAVIGYFTGKKADGTAK